VGDPYAAIGRPNPRGRAMAQGALARLRHGSRRTQRDLQILAAAWYPYTSCFRPASSVPHAEPSPDDLAGIIRYFDASNSNVVSAAFAAARSFAVVCSRCAYAALPPSIWDIPGIAPAVVASLESPIAATRLGASALVNDHPSVILREALHRSLDDGIFTVRWRAIRALAAIGATADLVEVLARSQPFRFDPDLHYEYTRALDSLRVSQDSLPRKRTG
jgi:hypothetical protein